MTETQAHSGLKDFFISPGEARLRSGWRIVIHTILYNILIFCLAIPYGITVYFVDLSAFDLWISQFISLFAVTLSVFLARRFVDRRAFCSLGIRLSPRLILDLAAGFSIAGLMQALIFGLEMSLGWLEIEAFAWDQSSSIRFFDNLPLCTEIQTGIYIAGTVAIWLLFYTLTGWNEELLFRGYRLQNMAEGLNPWWGLLLSSLWFGAAHWLNPSASWKSTIGICLAGVFLAYGYLRTRQLWLPIGLHIGWNFFEGTVFGFPVSGMSLYSIVRTTVSGPESWTGGAFGPEAGLILLPALIFGAILVYLYSHRRKPDDRSSPV